MVVCSMVVVVKPSHGSKGEVGKKRGEGESVVNECSLVREEI
jgi:hypothetical protein